MAVSLRSSVGKRQALCSLRHPAPNPLNLNAHRIFPTRSSPRTSCTSPSLLLARSQNTVDSSACNYRSYHSQDRDPPPPFSNTESTILASALSHVPTHGFSETSLLNGLQDAGYPEVSINWFPRGTFDLIIYYLVSQRRALRDAVQFPVGSEIGTGAKVRSLVVHRLLSNREVIRHWQHALATMAQPSYVPTSLHELFLLSDEIWHLAGDTAVDSSWYSKRASLAAIYSSAEVFMTTDASSGFKETQRFLDRRLEDIKIVGDSIGAASEWASFSAKALVNVLRSKGMKI